jgi:predicted glutamine amidotransferase
MCLIIHHPKTAKQPSLSDITDALTSNADGVGIMLRSKRNKLSVIKHLDIGVNDLYDQLTDINNLEYAIHFRFATHGKVHPDNLHPFALKHGGYLMHNGILPNANELSNKGLITDTLGYIQRHIDTSKLVCWDTVAKHITSSNKFVVMTKDATKIVNESSGKTHNDGNWYSNEYYKTFSSYYDDFESDTDNYFKNEVIELLVSSGNIRRNDVFGMTEDDILDQLAVILNYRN